MDLNRAQRAAGRHQKDEAVDSFVEHQEDEPVHSYPDSNKTLYRSGVVVRNDKNVGHEAMQRAREVIGKAPDMKLERPKTERLASREWFEKNRAKVERMIRAPFRLDKKQLVGGDMEIVNKREQPNAPRNASDDLASYYDMDMGNYRPQVDDDAEVYIPISER